MIMARQAAAVLAALAFTVTAESAFAQSSGARCGTVEGLALLYDEQANDVFSPHGIADYAVERYHAEEYGPEARRAWANLAHRLHEFQGADAATIQAAFPEYSQTTAEDLEDLIQIREAIVILEGAYLKPEIVARLISQDWENDWRGEYMDHATFLSEFSRIAGSFITDGYHPSLASTITHMIMLNWFDQQHTGRDMSEFNSPKSWSDVSRNDMSLRYQVVKETLGDLPDWISSSLNRYAANRNSLLECLAFEQDRWHDIAVPGLTGIKVRAALDGGSWCRETVAIRVEFPDIAGFGDIARIAQAASEAAAQACPAAREVAISGWVDRGAARVYEAKSSTSAGWVPQETTDPATRSALLDLVEMAEAGDARSMVRLAQRYEYGVDLDRDLKLAFAWMSAAGGKGDSLAAAELARMHSDGIGTFRNLDEASRWADFSAAKGDPAGLFWRAMIDWPFNSPERFLESYKSGSLITDMIWQPTVDLELAASMCNPSPYAEDPDYEGPCRVVAETDQRIDELNKRFAASPPREVKVYSDTVGDVMFDMRDPIQHMGASMMMSIR